jgi:ribosomal protein L11 methyltransferase
MISDVLYAVTISTSSALGLIIDELLPSIELYPTTYFDKDDNTANVNLYYEEKELAISAKNEIYNSLLVWEKFTLITLDKVELVLKEVKKEDWSESWKVFFKVDKVSDRLVIKPSWKEYSAKPGEIILDIDPGMSFGTGSHGTTKACLQYLDEISAPGMSVIDMGCGSGILSLAASKLGLTPIHAFDYDPDSVRITSENLESVGSQVDSLFQQDLSEYSASRTFDIVIANILAPVLLMNADRIVAALAKDSKLMLSGILHSQFDEVVERFTLAGLSLHGHKKIDEWSTGLFIYS